MATRAGLHDTAPDARLVQAAGKINEALAPFTGAERRSIIRWLARMVGVCQ